jgi:ribonuclease Z
MSAVNPRHAVAYHFFNEEGTRYAVYDGIREVYDGPLSMGTDLMVWNITRDGITERMAVVTDDAWAVPGAKAPPAGKKGQVPPQISEAVLAGEWDVSDVESSMVGKFKEKYGLKGLKQKK